jgi:hypothetical protein
VEWHQAIKEGKKMLLEAVLSSHNEEDEQKVEDRRKLTLCTAYIKKYSKPLSERTHNQLDIPSL